MGDGASGRQGLHLAVKVGLALEPDAGKIRQGDEAVLDLHPIREAAERLEQVGVALVATQAQAGGDVQRHLVAAVRDAAAGRPAVFLEHVQGAQVLHQAVAQRTVELQPVAVRAHAAISDQVACVLHREQIFARRHRVLVVVAQRGLELEVERVARLLVPEQVVLRQRLGIGDGGVEVEASVGVHAQLLAVLQHAQDRVDAAKIFVERRAADLLLDHGIAAVDVAAHLVLELVVVLTGVVVATGGIDEDLAVRLAVTVAVGQQLEQGLALDLRHRVPHGHVDGADGDRALAMPTGLLVGEHGGPDLVGVQVLAAGVHQRFGIGFHDARDESLAHQLALTVAAVGVEAVADHRLAIANHVGDDGHQAQGHLAEVDVGVADGGTDRDGFLADFDDLHGGLSLVGGG